MTRAEVEMKVYRVTWHRKFPAYYQNKVSIRICTKRSLTAQLKAFREARHGPGEPKGRIVKVEVAEVGEFYDVTDEFLPAEMNLHGKQAL